MQLLDAADDLDNFDNNLLESFCGSAWAGAIVGELQE